MSENGCLKISASEDSFRAILQLGGSIKVEKISHFFDFPKKSLKNGLKTAKNLPFLE